MNTKKAQKTIHLIPAVSVDNHMLFLLLLLSFAQNNDKIIDRIHMQIVKNIIEKHY